MTAAYTRTYWNGQTHSAIDYGPRKRNCEVLATEIARIPLSDSEAELSIDALSLIYTACKLRWQTSADRRVG